MKIIYHETKSYEIIRKNILLYSILLRKINFSLFEKNYELIISIRNRNYPNHELITFIIDRHNVYFIFRNTDELFLKNNGTENCFHEKLISFDIDPSTVKSFLAQMSHDYECSVILLLNVSGD